MENNVPETLKKLIQYGDQCYLGNEPTKTEGCASDSQFERVTGCTSVVQIKTSLVPMKSVTLITGMLDQHERRVQVEGSADSRVTQGMLAILCRVFNGLELKEAMELPAKNVTNFFGFDQLLPTGRQNTFHNIITLIQSQLQRLSNTDNSNSDMQVHTGSITEHHIQSCGELLSAANPVDPRSEEVALLISGGVDSSVALKLLLDQGHKVRAYYLKIWLEDELAHMNACPWDEDIRYAQSVCDQFGVPLETVPLQKEYWQHVVQYTLNESRAGRTPNPDVMCNSLIKFGAFYEYVGRFHKKLASGHYAQVKLLSEVSPFDRADPNIPPTSASHFQQSAGLTAAHLTESQVDSQPLASILTSENGPADAEDPDEVALVLSADPSKDQAYFLCQLSQQQLRRCLFPIGHLPKTEVRALAKQFNLSTSERKDSQGICFLGKLKFGDFLEHYLSVNPGPIVDRTTKEVVGNHRGLWFHNIGQKAGLGFSLHEEVLGRGPWMVCEKDIHSNTIYVSNDPTLWAQQKRSHTISNIRWINEMPAALRHYFGSPLSHDPQNKYIIKMKVRHSPKFVYARVISCAGKTDTPTIASANTDTNTDPGAESSVRGASADSAQSERSADRFSEMQVVLLGEETPFVSPGQFMAFFEGNVCLGSGTLN
eukprot:gene17917-20406_t